MKPISIVIGLLFSFQAFTQTIEYDYVHWGYKDLVEKRLHVKQVLDFKELGKEQLKERTDRWLDIQYANDQVYEWRTGNTSSKQSWQLAIGEPYLADGLNRIWTKYLKCKDCIKTFKSGKVGVEGRFKIDFRFKDNRVLLVMSNFYSADENISVEDWMVKNGSLAVSQEDSRVQILTEFFAEVVNDYTRFVENPDAYIYSEQPELKSVDDW